MVPQSFAEWRRCIEYDCKINLTKEFAAQRLSVYQNHKNPETQKFRDLYGEHYLQQVIQWFQQV